MGENALRTADLVRFAQLVDAVDRHIREALAEDGHCKPYEGTWSLHAPSYFERTTAPDTPWMEPREGWRIELHCYLIGPSRRYAWWGDTLGQAIDAALADVTRWAAEGLT